MLTCRILKYVKTSRGLAMPGPKLVPLPDDEARRHEANGNVQVVEPPTDSVDASRPAMDRRGRRKMTRELGAAVLALVVALSASRARAETSDLKTASLTANTSTAVVPLNSHRNYLFICNTGTANPATCTTLGTATVVNGMVLPANCANPIRLERRALARRPYWCFSTSGTTLVWLEATDDASLSAPTPTPIPTPTPVP